MKNRVLMVVLALMMVWSIMVVPALADTTAHMQVDRYIAATNKWVTVTPSSDGLFHVTFGDTFEVTGKSTLSPVVFSPIQLYMHGGASLKVTRALSGLGDYVATKPGSVTFYGLATNSTTDVAMTVRVYIDPRWTVADLNPSGVSSSTTTGVYNGQQVGSVMINGVAHACLWSGTAASWVDLNPIGVSSSCANGIYNGQQVGYSNSHACSWSGTATSFVDLSTVIIGDSCAKAVYNGQQVGNIDVNYGDVYHACLWSGTAANFVDLNPIGAYDSDALGVNNGQQVGWVNLNVNSQHACLWSGTADSFIDLNPVEAISSDAVAIYNGQQVGWAWTNGNYHACLWSGTATSYVNLNPIGASKSEATGVYNGQQVGYVEINGVTHACLWSGTAASWIDLNMFLPVSSQTDSTWASGVYISGGNIWITGNDNTTGHALLWHYTPHT